MRVYEVATFCGKKNSSSKAYPPFATEANMNRIIARRPVDTATPATAWLEPVE